MKRLGLGALWKDIFSDEDAPDEVIYDPVHLAGLLAICLTAAGALFWMLWALLVCEGGLFSKVGPFLQVVFTGKTLADFGYEGHPYKLGIFEGWVVNVTALGFAAATLAGLWWIFEGKGKNEGRRRR